MVLILWLLWYCCWIIGLLMVQIMVYCCRFCTKIIESSVPSGSKWNFTLCAHMILYVWCSNDFKVLFPSFDSWLCIDALDIYIGGILCLNL